MPPAPKHERMLAWNELRHDCQNRQTVCHAYFFFGYRKTICASIFHDEVFAGLIGLA